MLHTVAVLAGVRKMSELYIDINKTKSTANDMNRLKSDLNVSAYQINFARTMLKLNIDAGLSIIDSRLKEVSESIFNEAAKAESLARALTHIVMKYNAAETAICGSADGIIGKDSAQKTEAEKTWWDKLVDWVKSLFGIKDEETLSPERQAEREHDLYMQSAIFDLMDEERFSENTWNSATLEQRKEILNSFMIEIALIMGISLNGPVNFFHELPNEKNLVTYGFYSNDLESPYYNVVSINTYVMEGNNSYKIMKTLIHEMRHAYQHAAVENPENFNVSEETINQWRDNFDHYIDGNDDFDAYQAQAIEYDANSFAKSYGSTNNVTPTYGGSWT